MIYDLNETVLRAVRLERSETRNLMTPHTIKVSAKEKKIEENNKQKT